VRVMAGDFDSHAETPLHFLRREFELSYLWTGLSFFAGIEAYVFGLAIRAFTTLPGAAGQAVALLLCATAAGMVAFAQQSLVTYAGIGPSLTRLIELLLHKVLLRSVAGYASIALSALALLTAVSSFCAFLMQAPPSLAYSKPKAS
jgi:hypothetical protein